jgi:hypothetical protein
MTGSVTADCASLATVFLILSIPRVRGQRIQYVFGQNRLRTLCI